jgi:hypothetical protein
MRRPKLTRTSTPANAALIEGGFDKCPRGGLAMTVQSTIEMKLTEALSPLHSK